MPFIKPNSTHVAIWNQKITDTLLTTLRYALLGWRPNFKTITTFLNLSSHVSKELPRFYNRTNLLTMYVSLLRI